MPAKRYKPQRRLKPKNSRLKKVLRNRFFWFGVTGLFVVTGAVYGIFFTPVFQIQHIEIAGAEKVSVDRLEQITKEYIPKRLLLFSINNIFLADVGKVAEHARQEFPEIDHIAVRTKFPNKVQVAVEERGGVAVWCQEKSYVVEISDAPFEENKQEQAIRSFRQCFALDSSGVIFEEKEQGREITISGSNTDAVLGDTVVEPALLSVILEFENEMNAAKLFQEVGLRVLAAHVISEERVNAKVSEGWEIYVNPAKDMNWQITKIQLVLEQEIPSEKRPLLEYIDLRFGDQAFIKYHN